MDFTSAAAYRPGAEPPRPFVNFEMRAIERRDNVSPDGVSCMVDVPFAIISAPGSRDTVEKVATEWLAQLAVYAKDGRVPPNWPLQYAEAFELWKKGEELPVHGTPIKTWPPLTPSQRKALASASVHTIEMLAGANEELRGRIGMGALGLQQMAQKWLEEGRGQGAMAQDLAATKVQLEAAMATIAELSATVKALQPMRPAK